MEFEMAQLAPRDRYKLLISTVVPRPIALVTSLDENGRINAAPFSFFNAMGSDPPLLVLGVGDREKDVPKDTARNIRQRREFVVNLVDEALAEAMNICAVDFPAGISETERAGLRATKSVRIETPRIAQSPINFECREVQTLEIGRNRIIIGEVLQMHVRDDLVDAEKLYVRTEALRSVGRMHGGGWYTRTQELFQIPRLSYEEWLEKERDEKTL